MELVDFVGGIVLGAILTICTVLLQNYLAEEKRKREARAILVYIRNELATGKDYFQTHNMGNPKAERDLLIFFPMSFFKSSSLFMRILAI